MRTRTLFILLLLTLGIIAVVAWSDSELDANSDATPAVQAATVSPNTLASANYGAMQAAVHGAGKTQPQIVVFIRKGFVGMKGCPCPSVFQMQVALKVAHYRTAKATGQYGAITATEVRAFQRKHGIQATGIYGKKTHKALSRYYSAKSRGRLQQVAHSRMVLTYEHRIVHAANIALAHSSQMGYSEGGMRALLPPLPAVPFETDCSGYATWLYKVSDLPDPSGLNYRIVGYTGTLGAHGIRIPAGAPLRPGDMVFYGGGFPFGHVAVVVNGFLRLVSSHGEPGIHILRWNYRIVSVVKRYF